MHITDDGIVIKNVDFKDTDKYVYILTANHGKLKALAPGSRGRGSKLLAATQLFSYGSFTFFEGRGYLKIDSAETKEQFFELSKEITALSLASYFMELLDLTGDSDVPTADILRLSLNALYALSKLKIPEKIIKPAFELRLLALSGFEPAISHCGICKKEPETPFLNLQNGILHCGGCRGSIPRGLSLPLPQGTLYAMRYILSADLKRIFSFSLDGEPLDRLNEVCEAFALAQLEHEFRTLSYYKSFNLGV
ncbi:MAG: DNA repair protein RecO [Bacillota bacterium]|nr:DNA repair protein RecO [Bacillota bacterium]